MEALSRVGKYDVMDVLGRGGMGVVYKAMDPKIGRLVAIKMMTVGFAENPDLLKRFYREAQSTGTLQHPNIVIVYELGDQDGNPYLVMEYLEGEGLDRIISARRPLTMVQRLDIIIQVCGALNYAHSRGIVHRDIKPANVVLLKDGAVKIVDFGIARIGGDALTRTGQVVGTINYMSPEQINAQVVDGRSDIWAAGVVAYQLLTFALPFEGADTTSTLLRIMNDDPPAMSAFMQDCPPELEDCVLRALAKDREERYQTAEDFAFDLQRVRERLCRDQVDHYIEQAKIAVNKSELAKGKELLLEVLKVDTQNIPAKQLLQQVQQLMQKQQRGEQVRQLRDMAQSAIEQKQYADALGYLDQALASDKSNSELQNLREWVVQARQRQQKMEDFMQRAESAQQADDLTSAQAAAAEALKLDPNHTRAKLLHSTLQKEIEQRSRQNQLQTLLGNAAKEISSRRFGSALEILKEAEAIDATAPELHALLKLAESGHKEEQRREELEAYSALIEEALTREDSATACSKVEEALLKYPNNPAMLKLRALAEKQKHAGEKKVFVDEQLAVARSFLDAGKSAEALQVLEAAVQKFPTETRLHSMLSLLRENAERATIEQRTQQVVRSAKEALRAKEYDKAVNLLEDALSDLPDSAEISDLLQFARDEASAALQRKRLQDAADEAQRLMAADEYEQAIDLLEETLREAPDEALRLVLANARRHVDDVNKKLESVIARAQRLLETRKADEAVTLLDSQPKNFSRSPAFVEITGRARVERERLQHILRALEESKAAQARNDTSAAVTIIQKCRETAGDAPELTKALADIDARRASAARAGVERAMRDARMLHLARQFAAALPMLEAVAEQANAVSPDLKSQFDKLLEETRAGAARQQVDVAKGTTQTGETIVATPAARAAVAASVEPAVREPARAPAVRPPALQPRKKTWVIAGVAVVLLAVVVAGYLLRPRPPAFDSYVSINAVPWGTVKTVTGADGKVVATVDQVTPVRIALPAGDYKVTVAGPNGTERVEEVRASRESAAAVTVIFEAIDVEKIVNSH